MSYDYFLKLLAANVAQSQSNFNEDFLKWL